VREQTGRRVRTQTEPSLPSSSGRRTEMFAGPEGGVRTEHGVFVSTGRGSSMDRRSAFVSASQPTHSLVTLTAIAVCMEFVFIICLR
jgi:hypothetical protein